MAVYVDPLCRHGWILRGRSVLSCHMFADEEEELHELASKIGLKRTWFQSKQSFPHYDLTESKRMQAVAIGAVELSGADLLKILRRIRNVSGSSHPRKD